MSDEGQTQRSPEEIEAAIEKAKAETAQARSAAALADVQLQEAQARVARIAIDRRKAEIDLERSEIDHIHKVHEHRQKVASDAWNHYYIFNKAVSGGSAQECIDTLNEWALANKVDRLNKGDADPGPCPMTIVFNSPGGSAFDGLALFDHICTLRAAGHHFTTVALGCAASMAGILLQAGDKRVMGRESFVLIHEISMGAIGKIGEIEDRVELGKMMCRRIVAIFAARSRLTAEEITAEWRRTDWWLDSAECLAKGLVDEVVG